MEVWLWLLVVLLFVIVLIFGGKIVLMRRSAREISAAFADRLMTETNILIDISSHDRDMCSLAADINTQLRRLRSERLRYQQGNRAVCLLYTSDAADD